MEISLSEITAFSTLLCWTPAYFLALRSPLEYKGVLMKLIVEVTGLASSLRKDHNYAV